MVFATYDNDLKRDYLRLMPGAEDMMNISSSPEGLAESIADHYVDRSKSVRKLERGYAFSKDNTWKNVTDTYLRLWGVNFGD